MKGNSTALKVVGMSLGEGAVKLALAHYRGVGGRGEEGRGDLLELKAWLSLHIGQQIKR